MTLRTAATFVSASGVAAVVARWRGPSVSGWIRPNFRDRPVSLSGGAAAALGGLAGSLLTAALRPAALIAAGTAAVAGAYDDLIAPRTELRSDKGVVGHIGALRTGRISGGAVKVALIGLGSVAASTLLPGGDGDSWVVRGERAGLIAATANLVNLFDLRPGRATKVTLFACSIAAVSGQFQPLTAAVAGAGLATLPGDLSERTMLGDLGLTRSVHYSECNWPPHRDRCALSPWLLSGH